MVFKNLEPNGAGDVSNPSKHHNHHRIFSRYHQYTVFNNLEPNDTGGVSNPSKDHNHHRNFLKISSVHSV
jgi:hypothetical protein